MQTAPFFDLSPYRRVILIIPSYLEIVNGNFSLFLSIREKASGRMESMRIHTTTQSDRNASHGETHFLYPWR